MQELSEAAEWYEAQRPGLGAAFVRVFRATADSVAANPFQYQMFGKVARRASLRGFPHGLIYSVSDEEIVVLACFHGRRDPRVWLD
jgi:plasmid stabilization system protein ParE